MSSVLTRLRRLVVAAPAANAFQNNPFFRHLEPCPNFSGYRDGIVGAVFEIYDRTARRAVQVVMGSYNGVEAFGTPENLHHIHDPNFGKGGQGTVHRVDGNIGMLCDNTSINHMGRRMNVGVYEFTVDGDSLGYDFQPMPTASIDESIDFGIPIFMNHVSLK